MTTLNDITGVSRCVGRKAIDIADRELWILLEGEFPGLRKSLLRHRAPGERVHIPHDLETPRERARKVDDGVMTVRELADISGVSVGTAWAARNEKGRE